MCIKWYYQCLSVCFQLFSPTHLSNIPSIFIYIFSNLFSVMSGEKVSHPNPQIPNTHPAAAAAAWHSLEALPGRQAGRQPSRQAGRQAGNPPARQQKKRSGNIPRAIDSQCFSYGRSLAPGLSTAHLVSLCFGKYCTPSTGTDSSLSVYYF